ncbi:hypothetical protein [Flavobacterium sp.]|uniref:hypothetical protein n=1 Tax=Flavobacterium sp. TaxID=239 RepID=UPI003BC92FCD
MHQNKYFIKKYLLVLLYFVSLSTFSQKDCEYSSNVKDSIGTYKSTKDYVIHEKVFGNSQTSLFFSLINADGLVSLNFQMVQKSDDFIPAKCFDKNSKIFIQLTNGKVISLLGLEQDSCGNLVRVENKNCRLLSGYFLFTKDSLQDLKNYPISFFRV